MNYSCKLCGHEYGTRPPKAPLIALHIAVSHKGETMKKAEWGNLQAWQGTANVILSDQRTGALSYFLDWDDLINHLYLTGNRDAARDQQSGEAMKNYDLLKDGSRARLNKMRAYAKDWNAKRPNKIDWRGARRHGVGAIGIEDHGPIYSKDGNSCALPSSVMDGLRDCGAAHEIVRMRHTRWFTDMDGCESISGHVWQLPSRYGSPVYTAGYVEESGYTVLDCTNGRITMFEEKTDAALAADRLAEIAAEKEREYAELYNEAREVQDKLEQERDCLRDARREVSEYIKVLRDLPAGAASRETVCELIYDARRIMKFTIRSIMECRDKLADYARRGVEV